MLPMKDVRLQLGDLLAADTTTLAPVAANKIALIVAPFTPSENLAATDLTLGSSNGLSPLAGIAGAQDVALDAITLAQQITLKPPVSGWRWVSSGVFSASIVVYGYALLDTTLATLLAVQALAEPIVIQDAGYSIDVDPVLLIFVTQPMD